MNLHAIVRPVITAVNPDIPVEVRISVGFDTAADGSQEPLYATPGSFTGAIAGTALAVSAVATGTLLPGQTIAGPGVAAGTVIISQESGDYGGPGNYVVNVVQTVAEEAMTSSLPMRAQVQPMSYRDLAQVEGLNLNGTRRKIYLYGATNGIVRVKRQGGDLVVITAEGVNRGVFLVAQVLEQFPNWVSAAVTLQNEDPS